MGLPEAASDLLISTAVCSHVRPKHGYDRDAFNVIVLAEEQSFLVFELIRDNGIVPSW